MSSHTETHSASDEIAYAEYNIVGRCMQKRKFARQDAVTATAHQTSEGHTPQGNPRG